MNLEPQGRSSEHLFDLLRQRSFWLEVLFFTLSLVVIFGSIMLYAMQAR